MPVVTVSPRMPAGQYSLAAWEAFHRGPVYAVAGDHLTAEEVRTTLGAQIVDLATADDGVARHVAAVRAAGIPVTVLPRTAVGSPGTGHSRSGSVAGPGTTAGRELVWLVVTEDPLLPRLRAAGIQMVIGSADPPGAKLLDVVAIIDRLRSPGGCPWTAEQTHESLLPYLVEEAYETLAALEDGDAESTREELGDLLLQVVFHARIGQDESPAWSVDGVAATLAAKLTRRHPHVFAGREVAGTDEIRANWDAIKRTEKRRLSVIDGVPPALPALALAEALARRAASAGVPADLLPSGDTDGEALFATAAAIDDAEGQLRAVARSFLARLVAAETAARAAGADPGALDAAGWRRYFVTGDANRQGP